MKLEYHTHIDKVKEIYNGLDEDSKTSVWCSVESMMKQNDLMKRGIITAGIVGLGYLVVRKIKKSIADRANKQASDVIDI